jgi:ribosomal protein S3
VGQKVHPYGFRLGFNKTWRSRWYSDRDYAKLLHEDLALRQNLKKRFSHAGVSRIETERAANKLKIDIYTSRPGIIIGRKGTEVDKLKQEIQKRTSREIFINIQEIQKPELEAQLISESVAVQLEKARRLPPRDAQGGGIGAAVRRARHQGACLGPVERRRNRALRVVSARAAAAADAARGHRLRLCRGEHDLRPDRREGVALQGRAADAAPRSR